MGSLSFIQYRGKLITGAMLALSFLLINACNNNANDAQNGPHSKYILPAYKKAVRLSSVNPDSTLMLCDYIIRLMNEEDKKDTFYTNVQLLRISSILNKGYNEKAHLVIQEVIDEKKHNGDKYGVAIMEFQKADLLSDEGNIVEALKYVDQSLTFLSKEKYPIYRASSLNLRGLITSNLGRFKEADSSLSEALLLYEQNNNTKEIGSVLQNIGNLYYELKDTLHAKDYYLRSAAIKEKIEDMVGVSSIMNNVGLLHRYSNPDSALYYYNKVAKPNGDKDILKNYVIAQFNIGNIYKDAKKYDSALYVFNRVNDLCRENNIQQGYPRVLFSFGDIAYEQGNYNKAIAYINQAIDWCDSLHLLSLKQVMLEKKVEVFTSSKQFQEALLTQQQSKAIADSMQVNETREQMLKIEKANNANLDLLEKLKKEKEAAKKAEYWQWAGILSITLFVVLLFIYFVTFRKNKTKSSSK